MTTTAPRLQRVEATARPPVPWAWVALGAAVVTGWVVFALAGGADLDLAGLQGRITPAGAAAAAGVALLAGAATRPSGWELGALLFGLLAAPPALALAGSGLDARPLVVVVAAASLLAVTAGGRDRTARLRAVALAGMGTTLVGAAVFSNPGSDFPLGAGSDAFGGALVAGAVLLVLAGAGGTIGVPALKPLLAVGLLAGLFGAASVGGMVVPLLVGAAAVGVVSVRPAVGVALFAVAAAALPGGQPAAALIAAGAVVALAVERDWAVLAALPGGISLVSAFLLPGAVAPRVIVGLAALLIDVQLARRLVPATDADPAGTRLAGPVDLARLPGVRRRRAERHRLPAAVIGIWLVVAPGSWAWAGDTGLGHYDLGAGRAAAVALLVMTGLAVADRALARRPPTMER